MIQPTQKSTSDAEVENSLGKGTYPYVIGTYIRKVPPV